MGPHFRAAALAVVASVALAADAPDVSTPFQRVNFTWFTNADCSGASANVSLARNECIVGAQ